MFAHEYVQLVTIGIAQGITHSRIVRMGALALIFGVLGIFGALVPYVLIQYLGMAFGLTAVILGYLAMNQASTKKALRIIATAGLLSGACSTLISLISFGSCICGITQTTYDFEREMQENQEETKRMLKEVLKPSGPGDAPSSKSEK